MTLSRKKQAFFFLLLILALTVYFRFHLLAEIPPALYPDVAINGNEALEALKNQGFKVFYPENNGREGLFINLIALSFAIFGPSVWAIKLVPAIFGALTVLGLYFLTKKLFQSLDPQNAGSALAKKINILSAGKVLRPETVALFSSFFLAISFWHVNFSRIGFRAIMLPFLLVWSFYFLFKAIDSTGANIKRRLRGILFFLTAGLLFGLGFHTYIAFRLAPLILTPIFLIEVARYWPAFKEKIRSSGSKFKALADAYIKDGWFRWDIFFAAIILAALPLVIYYFANPADFMGRAGQVSVFSSQNAIKTLAVSTIKTLGQFVVWGDGNWRHNLSGSPQVFWPLIPFFIIGLAYSIRQIFRKRNYKHENLSILSCCWTLLVWWGTMLLPSILTSEGLPHALRSIGAIPPTYIFVGLGFYLFIKKITRPSLAKNKKTALAIIYFLIFLFLLGNACAQYYRYFVYWARNTETKGAFTQRFVDEANFLNSLPQAIKKYVIVNEEGVPVPYPDGIPMPAQTIKFLTSNDPSITYLLPAEINQLPDDCCDSGAAILPMTHDENLFEQLKQKFPKGKIQLINDFSIFKL